MGAKKLYFDQCPHIAKTYSSQCNQTTQIEQVQDKNIYSSQYITYNVYVIAVLYDLLHFIGILGPYVIFVLQYIVAEVLINMPYVPVTFYNLGKAVGRITNSLKVWYAKRDIIII